MDFIYLPVSLGEAIDKLTILDIKLLYITDKRKEDVQKEYDILCRFMIINFKLNYQRSCIRRRF
jgi:hypothetical protein